MQNLHDLILDYFFNILIFNSFIFASIKHVLLLFVRRKSILLQRDIAPSATSRLPFGRFLPRLWPPIWWPFFLALALKWPPFEGSGIDHSAASLPV